MELEKVKDKIRKLLAIAADDAQADGEIVAAMKLAEAAMRAHQLERADLEAETQEAETSKPIEYGEALAAGSAARLATWENRLYGAVRDLVGTVDAYCTWTKAANNDLWNSAGRTVRALMWYGPAEDAEIAKQLFSEWRAVIATLAQGKYGGAYRGLGARYADGFADALAQRAKQEAEARRVVVTSSTTAIIKSGTGSLAQVLEAKKQGAKTWLTKERNIQLGKGGKSNGYGYRGSGDWDARIAGHADGSRADFSAKRKPRLGVANG